MTKADWLRSKIEELERMKLRDCTKGGYGHSHNPWGCGEKLCEYCKHMEDGLCESNHSYSSVEVMVYNQALTTIITRYKEELKELTGE